MKLTAAKLRTLGPGRHNDGAGLYFLVREHRQTLWIFRFRWHGRQLDMAVGAYPEMTLAQARAEARAAGALRRAGVNPIEARKAERKARARAAAEATERSLQAVAESYIARHAPAWSKTHHLQWLNSLRTNVYPRLGARDVATIDRSAILDVLESLWMRVPESADRIRRRLETILDSAQAQGLREAPNPARWRDLRHHLAAPKKLRPVVGHAALPCQQMPAFVTALRARGATAARATEFLILTAARTAEVLGRGGVRSTYRLLPGPYRRLG